MGMGQSTTDFELWLERNGFNINLNTVVDYSSKALETIGVPSFAIGKESDPLKVRLLASDLIMKRDICGLPNSGQFINVVQLLILYADYLEHRGAIAEKDQEKTVSRDVTYDSLTIAYYLSRVNQKAVHALGYKSFSEAFQKLSKILEQKPSTIKNMRDEFDPYFDNGRVGWYQRTLSPSRAKVFEEYKSVSDEDLYTVINQIITYYKEKHEAAGAKETGRKRIVISGGYKEIKAGKH